MTINVSISEYEEIKNNIRNFIFLSKDSRGEIPSFIEIHETLTTGRKTGRVASLEITGSFNYNDVKGISPSYVLCMIGGFEEINSKSNISTPHVIGGLKNGKNI